MGSGSDFWSISVGGRGVSNLFVGNQTFRNTMESLEHPNDTVKNKDNRAGLKVFIPNGISKILSGDLYKSAVQIQTLVKFHCGQ